MWHSIAHLFALNQSAVVPIRSSIFRRNTRWMLSTHVSTGVKHLLSGPTKTLFASSTAPSPLLHLLLVLLSVPVIVIIVDDSIFVAFWAPKPNDYWHQFLASQEMLSIIVTFWAPKPKDYWQFLVWREMLPIIVTVRGPKPNEYWHQCLVSQEMLIVVPWGTILLVQNVYIGHFFINSKINDFKEDAKD